ncbi:MAG: hypothetical protein NTV52_30925, partial [Acidobacteria bacterium]|nr:hypothetical protein [Acidobacteriota bacterium]
GGSEGERGGRTDPVGLVAAATGLAEFKGIRKAGVGRTLTVNPGRHHARYLLEEMLGAQIQGAQTNDAVLAALAREHGATLASTDVGFRRFPSLSWINPLA